MTAFTPGRLCSGAGRTLGSGSGANSVSELSLSPEALDWGVCSLVRVLMSVGSRPTQSADTGAVQPGPSGTLSPDPHAKPGV